MWRQYAVDCAKDRRMTPTVADAMFARVDNSSASSALGAIFITDRQWRLAVERRGSRRARRRKKRSIFSKRVRVPAFHRNGQTPIKGSTLTSLITGTDEASRRGADTGERRATRPRTFVEIARDRPLADVSAEVGRDIGGRGDVTNVTNPAYRREGEIEGAPARARARMLAFGPRIQKPRYFACACVCASRVRTTRLWIR